MIKNISIDLLVPFENHPFKKRNGIEHQELTESIKENGLLEPIIVRSFPAGKYEIISGHRRVEACKELGSEYGRKSFEIGSCIQMTILKIIDHQYGVRYLNRGQ